MRSKLFGKCQSFNQQGHVLALKKTFYTRANPILINLIDGQVLFEPVLTGELSCCLNLRLDHQFGLALPLNLGLDLGSVLQSSGSNFGSDRTAASLIGTCSFPICYAMLPCNEKECYKALILLRLKFWLPEHIFLTINILQQQGGSERDIWNHIFIFWENK
jgi:hypothetical protein